MGSTTKLNNLRKLMSSLESVGEKIAAYIVPSEDLHQNEYVSDCDKRREFISGFTGSAGTAVVTDNKALLWVDGRYYIQASQQIDTNWTLMKMGLPETPTIGNWLSKNLEKGSKVGLDPELYGETAWEKLEKEIKGTASLIPITPNLIDLVWAQEKPKRPDNPLIILPLEKSGQSTAQKIEKVRQEVKEAGCDVIVLTELDEIAWVLNLRGSDIAYNPVFYSFVIITQNSLEVFMSSAKLTPKIEKSLELPETQTNFHSYGKINEFILNMVQSTESKFLLSFYCNHALMSLIPIERRTVQLSPIALLKAIKNECEVRGMEKAHVKDGAALCHFFAWLMGEMGKGTQLTELSAAAKLLEFRKKQPDFKGESFEAISSSGPNAAIIHYAPNADTNRNLSLNEIYLIDSGGQYLDGTTDVTRTVHFSTPSEYEKECFTRVLKGVISLVSATFPNRVVGNTLDTLARKALWDVGLDYIHGTGHGIGHFLNVHEGPHGISYKPYPNDPGLQENMFSSNEPGYYEAGKFGIRIENIVRVVKAKGLPYNFANRGYLTFADVTFVPIQQKMIQRELLTPAEIKYVNEYHEKCRTIIGSYMKECNEDKTEGYEWLLKETQPLL